MGIKDFIWSPEEKKIARTAFDKAHQNEINEIKSELVRKVNNLTDLQNIWSLESYLSEKRKEMNRIYDYRYSVLIIVFGTLLVEGLINERDLKGLSEDKLEAIRIFSIQ